MTTDSYKDYMYDAATRKEYLTREIRRLAKEIEGIDFLLKYSDLGKREATILMDKRRKLYDERESLINEFVSI